MANPILIDNVPSPFEIDYESALLIAELQLEDSRALAARSKGKSRADAPLSDHELALRLQAEELSSWRQLHRDASLARSVGSALDTDAALIEAFRLVEEAVVADRRAAELLQRGGRLPVPTEAQRKVAEDRGLSGLFEEMEISDFAPSVQAPARAVSVKKQKAAVSFEEYATEIGSWKVARASDDTGRAGPSVDRFKRVACVSCTDKHRVGDLLKGGCEHYWCLTCLEDVIEVYLRDESLHPLRCCQKNLSLADVPRPIKRALFASFEQKRAEYEVPAQDRLYCSTPTCSHFLGSAETLSASRGIQLLRTSSASTPCPLCHAQTCLTCRKPAHIGDSCSQNEAIAQVRTLAREAGWQTCPGCSAVVELHHGCNHMVCRCRTEFCYVCGVRWKNCPCDQWEERRLVATAEVRAENVMGRQARVDPVLFRRAVEENVQNLRVNHGCLFHSWRGRTGGGHCEECGDYLPIFLKMCTRCNLLVCRRCSLNRL